MLSMIRFPSSAGASRVGSGADEISITLNGVRAGRRAVRRPDGTPFWRLRELIHPKGESQCLEN
jgi:hypothetical protein